MRGSHSSSSRHRPRLCALALACGAFILPASSRAEPAPALAGTPQLFIQRGQSLDVTLDGSHLQSVTSVALPHPRGLTVDLVDAAKNAKPDPAHLRLHLVADADAVLGARELRVVGPDGVSAPFRVSVGQYPEVQEKEPNNTPDQAQPVSFPATLAGRIDAAGDIDVFRFSAGKGQRLVFDVHAARDRSPLDPLLTIHDEAGHELPLQIDLHDNDPVAVLSVPADGSYILSIRDLQYRGGGDYAYRIDAGAIPYVQSIMPMSAQPGKIAEIKPLGVNLERAAEIPVDLTYANGGQISVRARTPGGISNAMKVDVNEMAPFVDQTPAHSAADARAVNVPVDISGRIEAPGDENFFKFHLARKQLISLESITRTLGSPMDALLTLRDAKGGILQVADGSQGRDAGITRVLDPGDYSVTIRDLFFNGGPRYSYRLQIRPGSAQGSGPADFSVRFLPDALRVSQGGNVPLFVDVRRIGDFKSDVTVTLEDLPPGVSCPPLLVNDKLPGASGMLVISAAAEAAAGSFPIRLRAVSTTPTGLITHEGAPMLGGSEVESAYLTVLHSAPFTIEPAVTLTSARVQQLTADADALAARLAAADPQRAAAQAEWEKKVAEPVEWTTLDHATVTSANGTEFKQQEDGSYLATGASPDTDTYTYVVTPKLSNITAIRLEAIPDPSLPGKGPGRNVSGNFVLSHFTAAIAPAADPAKSSPVAFERPVAEFEQNGYPVIDAIVPKPGKGWAMYPRGGTPNQAVFFTAKPISIADGSTLTFKFEQNFSQQHTLGRFRLSATTDPQARLKAGIPRDIAALLATPADKRSPDDSEKISRFYASVDPRGADDRATLSALRAFTAVPSEIARLQAALAANPPELKAEQEEWEKSVQAGHAWLPLRIKTAKSQAGATLTKQPDDSLRVSGIDPMTDVYTLVAPAPVRGISAIRIEAMADADLPAGGPGRSSDGNFVLSSLTVTSSAKESAEENPPVHFASARATFEQKKFSASDALASGKDAGWAILPNAGKPSVATFYAAEPFATAAGSTLTITLAQNFSTGHHTLGHFRIWVTSSADPDLAPTLPDRIIAAMMVPAKKRKDSQINELADYFKAIAPSLAPLRRRLEALQEASASELIAPKGKKLSVPFLVSRAGFNGDVHVTLEGFVAGRDPATSLPTPLNKSLKVVPLDLPPNKPTGTLEIDIERGAPPGSRYCLLRAEGKMGDETRVEYSFPFVVKVTEK